MNLGKKASLSFEIDSRNSQTSEKDKLKIKIY